MFKRGAVNSLQYIHVAGHRIVHLKYTVLYILSDSSVKLRGEESGAIYLV